MIRPLTLIAASLLLMPGLAMAQATSPATPTPLAGPPPATVAPSLVPAAGLLATPRVISRQARTDQLEIRIRDLHTRLRITPAEEPQWAAFADIMRANAKEMGELYRAGNPQSMSAVDALQHYAKIARAHSAEIDSLMVPFQTLYNEMDAAQKKLADDTFHSFGQRGRAGG